MKILILHSELGVLRGGGENFTRNLFLAFAERGHDVSAAFIADHKGRYPILLPAKIRPIPLAGRWSRKLGQEALSNVARQIPQGTQLRARWDRVQEAISWRTVRWHDRRFTRRIELEFGGRWKEFDAVYVHGSALLASRVARYCPTVLRLPGPVSADLAPVLKAVHVVCANGDALSQIGVFLGDHAVELPVGLDGDVFNPGPTGVRERLGWTMDNWVIGYVGRLAYIKGVDLLAVAFGQLRRSMPHARLLIVGSGEEEKKLRAGLNAELMEGIVHIESDVPHDLLAEWYRAMDLFVMPSRYENYSNAVLEALACGVPFLVSDVGGNRRLMEMRGGWIFTQSPVDSLAKTICSIAENPCLARDRGAFGGEKVHQCYSWETSAKRLEEILQSCLDMKVRSRMQTIGLARVNDRTSDSLAGALAPVEYAYYFVIIYTVVGPPYGLTLMGNIGSGFLLIPVLSLCAFVLGPLVLTVLRTAWIPLACGASYLFIQLVLHEESIYGVYVYQFGPWLMALVIVQALAMHRPGFLHRFAWLMLFIGLAMLPFISLHSAGKYERIGGERGSGVYANSNAIAGWFGFCVTYMTIKGYVETRPAYRLAAWLIAVGSLYMVALTVSRGAVIAIAASLLIASRRFLKAGFLPVFLLAGLVGVLQELGVFDDAIKFYTQRGAEDTGRFQVWPLLIEQFLSSPVIGVGASKAGAVTAGGMFRTPHNGFLLIAVAAGAMPLILFCAYFFRSGMAALRANMSELQDTAFYLPLVVYALLITCAGNLDFMTPWAVVSLAVPIAASVYRMRQGDTK